MTGSVRFESTSQGWRARLPAGACLPEPVVVEQGAGGLVAHLEEPLDQSFVFPCRQQEDGSVLVTMERESPADLFFRPDTLEYGIQGRFSSLHRESVLADGTQKYAYQSERRLFEATRSPSGEWEGFTQKGEGRRIPMTVSSNGPGLLDFKPLGFKQARMREQGFWSGLLLGIRTTISPSLGTFTCWDRNDLFPRMLQRARAERERQTEIVQTVTQLARPPLPASGIQEMEEAVAVGGVVVRRREESE